MSLIQLAFIFQALVKLFEELILNHSKLISLGISFPSRLDANNKFLFQAFSKVSERFDFIIIFSKYIPSFFAHILPVIK
ncbi:TPA: hypothetical protein DEG21_01885 [Patescibacteria group bacterium]|nr:hypothetical protein [Candidatus Gracilibacteria bacterium]HBY74638.1 hypothetical protein [Candidatus Gracilibacteria bacterium]